MRKSNQAPRLKPSLALVWVDMEPLLKEERARCEAIAAELQDINQKLEQHHQLSLPAYKAWMQANFSEAFAKAHAVGERVRQLEDFVSAVEDEALYTGCSEKAAYLRLVEVRAGAEKIAQMRAEGAKDFGDDLDPDVDAFLRMNFEELYEDDDIPTKQYEKLFKEFRQDFEREAFSEPFSGSKDQAHQGSSSRKRPANKKPSARAQAREANYKQLYHDLARRLHPDLNPNLSPREIEIWHDVQAAFERRDLEQLELLSATLKSFEDGGESSLGFTKIRSLSRLVAIFKSVRGKVKAAKKSLRDVQQSPAWNFVEVASQPVRLKSMWRDIKLDLENDFDIFTTRLESLEAQIERWQAKAGRSRKRSRV